MEWNNFYKTLEKELNINLSEDQKVKLNDYYECLFEWNKKINLTSNTDLEVILYNHFLDSAYNIKFVDFKDKKVADIGSGAGFPAIIIKILEPSANFYLFESITKKCLFLENLKTKLNIDIKIINQRIEDFSLKNPKMFDICTARAVADISKLSKLSFTSLNKNGLLVMMKGPKYTEELLAFNKVNKNWIVKNIFEYNIQKLNVKRYIVIFTKSF